MTYNLMVLGKALIVSNSSLIPRVVRTDLKFNLKQTDYTNFSMKLVPLKNNFILLKTHVGTQLHGEVFVKLFDPKELK
ncbi:MAG: hypothetical protein WA160_05510 [Pseudobdellovibrio sp.]